MDPAKQAEIISVCEGIGFKDGDEDEKYILQPEWELYIKSLNIYLRRDDEDHTARRLVGKAQVVGRDLLPMFKHYPDDEKVWEVALPLLVNLTYPCLTLYNEEVPKNKTYLNYYYILEGQLRSYKNAFVDKGAWKSFADKLRQLLNLEWDKRTMANNNVIENILIVTRNILHVPADPAEEKRADDDTSLHDRILLMMQSSGFFDLILQIVESETNQAFSMHVLEILSSMLREQTGEQLAKTQLTRTEEEKERDKEELKSLREKETVLRNIQIQKLPTRHSRFGGTFVVRDMKAASGRDLLCHKPITSVADLSLDDGKKRRRCHSNKRPVGLEEDTRRSTIPIRMILKEFCATFLDEKYNTLMTTVKDNINRGKKEENDETYYLWALKFFMEFNRHYNFRLSYVSETISTNTFHYVQTLLDNYQGMMVTDKEKIALWSRRTHMALKAYQELLFTLMWMDKDGYEAVRETSRAIKNNVFYLPEYRELCLGLLNTYDPVKLSKLYLKDLIETNHLFLRMLEDYASQNRRVMIKCKGKRRKSKKESKNRKKARKGPSLAATMSQSELDEEWKKASGAISLAILSTGLPDEEEDGVANSTSENVIPFDAASDIPIDEQKETAVERIAVFLHTGKHKEAVLLLRASREVWPTDVAFFGRSEIDPTEEEDLLKSVFMEKASSVKIREARYAAENGPQSPEPIDVDENDVEKARMRGDDLDEEGNEEDEEDEEEERRARDVEQQLDFKGFVLKYAMARVVCNYALLFKEWDTLKPLTLHCILKMFHRFAFDMGYPALIAQASLFLTFKKVLQVADHRSDLKEAKQFFLHFWPKFVKLCQNKNMFIEILFWKTAREAEEIQNDYADLRSGDLKPKKKSDWTTDEDTELELLVELYRDSPDEVKKAQKLIEFIMERWTWRPRSKRMFINRLVEKELVDASEFAKKTRAPKTWTEEEVEKLRELYSEYKDSDDIMGSILEHMELKRSRRNVVAQLIDIGLISHKNEVKKKGKRSNPKSRSQVSRDSDSEGEREERMETNRGHGSDISSGSESSDSESDHDDERNTTSISAPTVPYDEEKVTQLGKQLLEKDNMSVAIRWVNKSFKDFLEDIIEDPDSDENVPLVPIDADCIMAIGNMEFKLFLKQLGVLPPGMQETYWRIPSGLRKNDVELRLEGMKKILDSNESKGAAMNGNRNQEKRSSPMNANDDSDNETLNRVATTVNDKPDSKKDTTKKVSSKKVVVSSDSSDDESTAGKASQRSNATSDTTSSVVSSVKKLTKKKRVAVDSDSDSDDDEKNPISKSQSSLSPFPNEPDIPSQISDEDVGDKRKELDSDSDDEDDLGRVVKKKRAFILDSDSDDD